VRDPSKERGSTPAEGVLTTDFAAIRDDPSIAVVAELMGGIDPAHGQVLELLGTGKPVVTANKQLVAQHGAELFAAAADAGVQLRFEASVCAAIPVIKVLREALVVTNVHRVLGIVNGTTNFILSAMSEGRSYADALAEAQRLGYAEADPTDDVAGLDAAAKMAILATVAFGCRVPLEWVEVQGIDGLRAEHVDEDPVTQGREHPRAEAAANDEVQRVGGILAMEHDLTARERAPAGDGEQPPDVLGRKIGEEGPVHEAEVSVTAVTFATSRARTTRPRRAPTVQA